MKIKWIKIYELDEVFPPMRACVTHICGQGGFPATEAGEGVGDWGCEAGGSALSQGDEVGVELLASQRK